MAKIKGVKAFIAHMLTDGEVIFDSESVKTHIVEYYRQLFSDSSDTRNLDLVQRVIPRLVITADNEILCKLSDVEEIKSAVFGLDGASSPGPDGFAGSFYHHCWDIIKDDLVAAVQPFLSMGFILPNLNSVFLVLLPKSAYGNSVDKYRPVALSNFIFKIFTKILATRLGPIAYRIISKNQFAFIKGRQISQAIVSVSENFNCMDKMVFGGNVALRVDTKKAFDTLRWDFLLEVLKVFKVFFGVCWLV